MNSGCQSYGRKLLLNLAEIEWQRTPARPAYCIPGELHEEAFGGRIGGEESAVSELEQIPGRESLSWWTTTMLQGDAGEGEFDPVEFGGFSSDRSVIAALCSFRRRAMGTARHDRPHLPHIGR